MLKFYLYVFLVQTSRMLLLRYILKELKHVEHLQFTNAITVTDFLDTSQKKRDI